MCGYGDCKPNIIVIIFWESRREKAQNCGPMIEQKAYPRNDAGE